MLLRTFVAFFNSEKAGSVILILCTPLSLAIARSALGPAWHGFWQTKVAGLGIEHRINGLRMAIFITSLAFPGNVEVINASTMAILIASAVAAAMGLAWLRCVAPAVKSA